MNMYLTGNEPLVADIARAAYPDYKGKKFRVRTAETVVVRSYWDGGSRSWFTFVQLTDTGVKRGIEVPQQSAFDREIPGASSVALDSHPGMVCVEHSHFCGKDMGITIILHPSMMSQNLFPVANVEMTDDEKSVLKVTCERKGTYDGMNRRESIGMPVDRWDPAFASLLAKKYIMKNGAVTPAGRNAHTAIRGY